MKYVVDYMVYSEEEWANDYVWRQSAGMQNAEVFPYGDGSANIRLVVLNDEDLAMVKLRHKINRIADYHWHYDIPKEDK